MEREREGALALARSLTHTPSPTRLPPTLRRGEDVGEWAASPQKERHTDTQTDSWEDTEGKWGERKKSRWKETDQG